MNAEHRARCCCFFFSFLVFLFSCAAAVCCSPRSALASSSLLNSSFKTNWCRLCDSCLQTSTQWPDTFIRCSGGHTIYDFHNAFNHTQLWLLSSFSISLWAIWRCDCVCVCCAGRRPLPSSLRWPSRPRSGCLGASFFPTVFRFRCWTRFILMLFPALCEAQKAAERTHTYRAQWGQVDRAGAHLAIVINTNTHRHIVYAIHFGVCLYEPPTVFLIIYGSRCAVWSLFYCNLFASVRSGSWCQGKECQSYILVLFLKHILNCRKASQCRWN